MHFIASAAAFLAMATSVMAQTADFDPIYTPKNLEVIPAGSTYEVTWTAPAKYAGDETVAISLIGGASQASLVPISTIQTGVLNSAQTYSWAVDAALGTDALYGLVFTLESDTSIFQYSMPFQIKAGAKESSVSSSVHTMTTSTGAMESPSGTSSAHIITTDTGVKTVTLTSCPPTTVPETHPASPPATTMTTMVIPTFAPNSTVPTWSTTSKVWNTTAVITSTMAPPPGTPTTEPMPVPTTGAPITVPTSGAARFAAGPLALFGGLALAFAL